MTAVRRGYLYLVCLASLQAVAWGTITVLRRLLVHPDAAAAQSLALPLAVIIVALPFFLVHWRWAQRDAARSAEDRASALRRLYLYGVLALALAPCMSNAYALLRLALERIMVPAGATVAAVDSEPVYGSAVRAVVPIVVFAIVALYHRGIVLADRASVGETGLSTVVRRLFVLGFSAAGATIGLSAAAEILRIAIRGALGGDAITVGGGSLLTAKIASLVVATAVWVPFWTWAGRLFHGTDATERRSGLRQLYLYALIFAGVAGTVGGAGLILTGLFRRVLGLPASGDLAVPLAAMVVLGASWAYHYSVLRAGTAPQDAPVQTAVRRVYYYLVAAVGLGALLLGLAGVVQTIVRALAYSWAGPLDALAISGFGAPLKERLAGFAALLVTGLPVWLAAWTRVQALAGASDPDGESERASTVRKFYLYGYLAVATLVTLACAVYVVYAVLKVILGGSITEHLGSDLAQTVAYAAIGILTWALHGRALRGDGRLAAADRGARLASLRTAVLDAGDGSFGLRLVGALRRALPDLPVDPVGVTPAAAAGMGGSPAGDLAERVRQADLVILSWPPDPGVAGPVATSILAALSDAPGRKLVVPRAVPGWDWTGVDIRDPDADAREVVDVVQRMAEGEGGTAWRPLGAWHRPAVVVAAIALTLVVFPVVMSLVSSLFEP